MNLLFHNQKDIRGQNTALFPIVIGRRGGSCPLATAGSPAVLLHLLTYPDSYREELIKQGRDRSRKKKDGSRAGSKRVPLGKRGWRRRSRVIKESSKFKVQSLMLKNREIRTVNPECHLDEERGEICSYRAK